MIAIIKGCGSNIASIQFALKRLGFDSIVTDNPDIIMNASHVILAGVGHALNAMSTLKKLNLVDLIKALKQPVLGICLGMQLLYEHSEEGHTDCLGIIPGVIRKMTAKIIPHMGWNNINQNAYAYFLHSFKAPINEYTITTTLYSGEFTSMVKYKNYTGMQFHPEKSGKTGDQLLLKFLRGEL
jgi:imidazole glycerol-phosphate synthase subunit HisH